jgi:hypothetical protein
LSIFSLYSIVDTQKAHAQDEGDHQAQHQRAPSPRLSAPHAHGHGKARGDQHRRIQRAPHHIELVRRFHKRRVVPVAVDQVGGKQAAEEHHFGQQEQPHGKAGRVGLLVHVLKVMAQVRGVLFVPVRGAGGPVGAVDNGCAIRH